MNKLEKLIATSSQKYYEDGTSELTDEEWDAALEQLKQEAPESPILKDVGHGYDISKDTTIGARVPHKYGSIGGLEKAHNWKELNTSIKETNRLMFGSPKIDGLSIVCYYLEGKLHKALTRGSKDGVTGIDVTDKVRYILDNKQEMKVMDSFTGAFRGEIVMSNLDFDNFKEAFPLGLDGKKAPSNPRNVAAGMMSRKDWGSELKYLTILFYHIVGYEGSMLENDEDGDMDDIIKLLSKNIDEKFVTPYLIFELDESSFENDMDRIWKLFNSSECSVYDFPKDGIVLNRRWFKHGNEISYDAQAFKFQAETKLCTVTDVIWNMSKTNFLIPVVQIEPTELSGATVTYATGFNADYILKNKIGPGAKVKMMRSGEVIPFITEVTLHSTNDTATYIPKTCPCCGTTLIRNGVHLQCPNKSCDNSATADMFCWINALVPLDNFGDKLRLKYLQTFVGKYNFTIEELMESVMTKGFIANPLRSQDNLFLEFLNKLKTRNFTMSAALKALNIPRLGDVTSRKLSSNRQLIIDMLHSDNRFDYFDELSSIVGNATALSIVLSEKFNRLKLIEDRIGYETTYNKVNVAVTGKLSVKRSKFEQELSANGYQLSNISRTCKFLITDNPNSNSDKNKKADAWGITKITEADFRKQYFK